MVQRRTIAGSLSRLIRIRQPNTAKATANLFTNNNSLKAAMLSLGLASVITCAPPAARADFAHLTLQSQSGDFIGQGGTFDIVYPSNEILAQIRRTLPAGPAELLFALGHVTPSPNTFALAFFGTDMLGIPIQPGVYGLPGNTAQRADFAQPGHAGLDISFQNRGCNTLTGNFTVTDVSFFQDGNGNLQIGSFDASFEQHCEGATPALFGTLTFQSSAVPEPTAWAMLGVGGTMLMAGRWFRRKSA